MKYGQLMLVFLPSSASDIVANLDEQHERQTSALVPTTANYNCKKSCSRQREVRSCSGLKDFGGGVMVSYRCKRTTVIPCSAQTDMTHLYRKSTRTAAPSCSCTDGEVIMTALSAAAQLTVHGVWKAYLSPLSRHCACAHFAYLPKLPTQATATLWQNITCYLTNKDLKEKIKHKPRIKKNNHKKPICTNEPKIKKYFMYIHYSECVTSNGHRKFMSFLGGDHELCS